MNRLLLVLSALALATLSGCVTISPVDRDARTAAVDWLAIVDSGNYEKSYNDRPPRILAGGDKDSYIRFMKGRRAPLGQPKSREFQRVTYTKKLSGAPDGNYGIMYFKTKFEHKPSSEERVTVTAETGRWQVSGYSFR